MNLVNRDRVPRDRRLSDTEITNVYYVLGKLTDATERMEDAHGEEIDKNNKRVSRIEKIAWIAFALIIIHAMFPDLDLWDFFQKISSILP